MLKTMPGHWVLVATKGEVAETYNIGGHNEKQNIDVVKNDL